VRIESCLAHDRWCAEQGVEVEAAPAAMCMGRNPTVDSWPRPATGLLLMTNHLKLSGKGKSTKAKRGKKWTARNSTLSGPGAAPQHEKLPRKLPRKHSTALQV
jgi:hypothetical protein